MLEAQTISIPFAGGLDTKTDEKLVVAGKLTLLENGVFNIGKKILKRNGYSALPTAIAGGGDLGTGSGLFTYGSELLAFSQNKLFSYSQSSGAWVDKGTAYAVGVGNTTVVRNSYAQSSPDFAQIKGLNVSAWVDARGGVRASVVDVETGAPVQSDSLLNANGLAPKVVAAGDVAFVFYADGTNLKARKLDPGSPTAFGSELLIGNDLVAASPVIDVAVSGLRLLVAYKAPGGIRVKYLMQDGTVGSPLYGLPNPILIAEDASNSLAALVHPTTQDIWLVWHNSSGALRAMVLFSGFTVRRAATQVDPLTAPAVCPRVTAAFASDSQIQIFYEVEAALAYDHYVKTAFFASNGAVSGVSVLKRSVGLASKAFQVEGSTYVACAYDTTLQATYFVVKSDGAIVAKALAQVAGGLPADRKLPQAIATGDSKVSFSGQVKTKFVSAGGAKYTLTGISLVNLDFGSGRFAKEAGGVLQLTGGYLSQYDGQSVVESGFHTYPENYAATPSASGGSIAAGSYLYFVVWEWVDNKGQVHRSAPGVGSSVTTSGASSSVTLSIPTLRLTAKTGARTDAVAAVYRTLVGGTVAYKLTNTLYNDPTVDRISYVDTKVDADISSNEILYTTGGIVDNIAPPACSFIETYKDRVFLASSEDRLLLHYSKGRVQGEAISFTDSFVMRVNPIGGDITAIKFMDDKLLIFKKDRIFVISGDGPNAAGAASAFTVPELVTSDVGCADADSLVLTPSGVMFKGEKGIYLCTRALEVQYAGADVEAYNRQNVTGACLIEDKNQVRFLTDYGLTLSYDYYFNQWSTFTNHQGVGSAVWNGSYAYMRNDGEVYVESASHYQDANVPFRLRIATAWLKLAGIQGFQRIRKAAFLGEYKSSHILRVSVGYDYETTYPGVYAFQAGAIFDQTYFGEDVYFGESSFYGAADEGVYQFRLHLARQKCESIRFLFEDVTAGTSGESYSISDLSLEVGVKKGINRMRAGKSVG